MIRIYRQSETFPQHEAARPKKIQADEPDSGRDDDPNYLTLYRGMNFDMDTDDEDAYAKRDPDRAKQIEANHKNPSKVSNFVNKTAGIHWSTDPHVAHNFAADSGTNLASPRATSPESQWKPGKSKYSYTDSLPHDFSNNYHEHGVVVSTRVHKKNLVTYNSKEYKKDYSNDGIQTPDNKENLEHEAIIRRGTPIKIQKAWYHSDVPTNPKANLNGSDHEKRTIRSTEIDPKTFNGNYTANIH